MKTLLFFLISALTISQAHWTPVNGIEASKKISADSNLLYVLSEKKLYRYDMESDSISYQPIDEYVITDIHAHNHALYAATLNYGAMVSKDGGRTWKRLGPDYTLLSIFATDDVIVVSIHGGGALRSIDNGATWNECFPSRCFYYAAYNDRIIATSIFFGILSSDRFATPSSWRSIGFEHRSVHSIRHHHQSFFSIVHFINEGHRVYRSKDGLSSWERIFPENFLLNHDQPTDSIGKYLSLYSMDDILFLATSSNRIFYSKDDGETWSEYSQGLLGPDNIAFCWQEFAHYKNELYFVSDGHLYQGNKPGATSINEPASRQDFAISLFPNPFKEKINIQYTADYTGKKSLYIYNIQGRLVNFMSLETNKGAETAFTWNGKDNHHNPQPSGVYLFRATNGKNSRTGKFLLIK